MPVSFQLSGALVEITAEGNYDLSELLQTVVDAYNAEGAPAFPRLLIDTRASRVRQSKQDIARRVAAIDNWRGPKFARRVALVVSKGRNHELAHFYSFYAEQKGTETRVFLDPQTARHWLLGEDQPSPAA